MWNTANLLVSKVRVRYEGFAWTEFFSEGETEIDGAIAFRRGDNTWLRRISIVSAVVRRRKMEEGRKKAKFTSTKEVTLAEVAGRARASPVSKKLATIVLSILDVERWQEKSEVEREIGC